ncbi:MAG: ATPase [Prevotella sp.]|nr:ATPase [Prevotella sp.]
MILIADSGSTKTDWAVLDEKGTEMARIRTQGMNPFHLSSEEMKGIIYEELIPFLPSGHPTAISFFGTGCTPDQIPLMRKLLLETMACDNVVVGSDLLGAARALCGDREGIACILGTGANCCLYDGHEIVANIPPLGYILGDEGSGAVLGKMFLNAIFKGFLSEEIKQLYLQESHQTYADIIRKVYREPLANRYLASTAKFISAHMADYPELSTLVKDNFRGFIHRNIDRYNRKDLPLNFVGSIAYFFQSELREVSEECGYRLGRVVQSPLDR